MIWKDPYGFLQVLFFCDADEIMEEITFFTKMAAFNSLSQDTDISRNPQEHWT